MLTAWIDRVGSEAAVDKAPCEEDVGELGASIGVPTSTRPRMSTIVI